jgi:hypothetical protein
MSRRELADLALRTFRDEGDALAGEQVIAQARQIGKPLVVPGTSTHRIQQVVLKSNVLCVIDRPFRLIERPIRLKE